MVGRIILDMAKEKKETSHIVFLPIRVISNLRKKVKKSLEGKHVLILDARSLLRKNR